MDDLLALLYVAYLIGLGQSWRRVFIRSERWRWTQLAWSFGLGAVIWSYAQLLANIVNLSTRGLRLYLFQILLVALPAALAWFRAEEPQTPLFENEKTDIPWVRYGAFVLLGIALLTATLQALAFPMHLWDSIVIYGFKAKILFLEQTFKTDAFLDPSVLHYSADYPLLIPYVESGFYRWLGHPDDRLVRLVFIAYWASWVGLVYEGLRSRLTSEYAWAIVAAIASTPLFFQVFMGQAASGFADIPLAYYWSGLLLCLIKASQERSSIFLIPFFAVGCAFTKNEGLPAVVIAAVLLIVADPSGRRAFWILPLGLAFAGLLPWFWVRHFLPHNAAHYARLSFPSGSVLWEQVKLIGHAFLSEVLQVRRWGLFWPLVLIGLLLPMKRFPFSKESKVIVLAVGIQALVYVYVYLTYPGNLEWLLPITLIRLLMHMVGPLTLALGWRLEERKV